jgi:hypothetical protein
MAAPPFNPGRSCVCDRRLVGCSAVVLVLVCCSLSGGCPPSIHVVPCCCLGAQIVSIISLWFSLRHRRSVVISLPVVSVLLDRCLYLDLFLGSFSNLLRYAGLSASGFASAVPKDLGMFLNLFQSYVVEFRLYGLKES